MSISLYHYNHPFGFSLFQSSMPGYFARLDVSNNKQIETIESLLTYSNFVSQKVLELSRNGYRHLTKDEMIALFDAFEGIRPAISLDAARGLTNHLCQTSPFILNKHANYEENYIHVLVLSSRQQNGGGYVGLLDEETVIVEGIGKLKIDRLDQSTFDMLSKISYGSIAFVRYNGDYAIGLIPRTTTRTKALRPTDSQKLYLCATKDKINIKGYKLGVVTQDSSLILPEWVKEEIKTSERVYEDIYRPSLQTTQNPYSVPLKETIAYYNSRFFTTLWFVNELGRYITPSATSASVVGASLKDKHEQLSKEHPDLVQSHELYCILLDTLRLSSVKSEYLQQIDPVAFITQINNEEIAQSAGELKWG